jgi:inosine-uridine nucleoside N-ribohydrolase
LVRENVFSSAFEAIQSALRKHAILLDIDLGDGIDDTLALVLILRSPKIALQEVTTVFGKTDLHACLAADMLHLFHTPSDKLNAHAR